MFYFDSTFFIYIIPALLFGLYAQMKIQSTYGRYSQIYSSRGMTGQQVARYILDSNGLYDIPVQSIGGNLTDHYDPRSKQIRLSNGVYNSSSIAAIGVAAHECGHAIQHAQGYAPLKIRNAIIPITNIGSQAAVPIILIGLFLNSDTLITIGIIGYALMAIFQLVTLPVEFNASSRALAIIDSGNLLTTEEHKGAKKVLRAAAMTYVAALVSALAQLMRMLALTGRRNND